MARPIVIDAFHFKQDVDGYLTAHSRKHLALLEVGNGAITELTSGAQYNDDTPAWSPDGKLIAYVSNHSVEPEQTGIDEIYLVEAHAGATPRLLVRVFSPNHQRLAFSPDGKQLGHKEVEDLLAAVDYAVKIGLADPARLGIGGWSYGGILTDYTISHDGRFKAAIAGAGSGN